MRHQSFKAAVIKVFMLAMGHMTTCNSSGPGTVHPGSLAHRAIISVITAICAFSTMKKVKISAMKKVSL